MYKRTIAITFASVTLLVGCLALAQESRPSPTTQHDPTTHADSSSLASQLADLRAALTQLESALNAQHQAKKPANNGSQDMAMGMKMMRMGMGMMSGNKDGGMSMGMMKKKGGASGMGMMSGGGMNMSGGAQASDSMGMGKGMGKGMGMGMGMGKKMMGMKMMGDMGSSVDQATHAVSALPGFPGASHIYHIGATGFFVDHTDHLRLSEDQLKALNTIRESETLKQSSLTRKIEELEQELWVLTSADQPDAAKIESKIREIEAVRTDQRISFIRAVGRAATTLSKEQVGQLKGEPAPDAHNH